MNLNPASVLAMLVEMYEQCVQAQLALKAANERIAELEGAQTTEGAG